jgi:hypothetical protein
VRDEIAFVLRETEPEEYAALRGAFDNEDQLPPSQPFGFPEDEELVFGVGSTPFDATDFVTPYVEGE